MDWVDVYDIEEAYIYILTYDDYPTPQHRAMLLSSPVVAGIVHCCWHRALLLASCVVGIVRRRHRALLLASYVVAGIVHGRWHRV